MLYNILKTFKLSEKEIKIFEKVRDLGTQPASSVARSLEWPRNTVRSILDNLVKQGLLVKSNRVNTQYYAIESKENLIRHLKIKKMNLSDTIEAQIRLIDNFGESLKSPSQKAKNKPKVTFYEGVNGIERVYEHTLTAKKPIKSWASFEGMHEALPEYFKSYYQRRSKKKIKIFSIHPDSDFARQRQENDAQEWRESALVPPTKFKWVPEIQVYDDFINIISWKEKLGIIIESQEISEALSSIFDLSFESAKKYNDKNRSKTSK